MRLRLPSALEPFAMNLTAIGAQRKNKKAQKQKLAAL